MRILRIVARHAGFADASQKCIFRPVVLPPQESAA